MIARWYRKHMWRVLLPLGNNTYLIQNKLTREMVVIF